jgi:hypothetical protein
MPLRISPAKKFSHKCSNMKTRTFLSVLLLISASATAQPKKSLAISVGGGWFNSPGYLTNALRDGYYGLGFDYHFTPRHVLSVNFLSGRHSYLDTQFADPTVFLITPGGTNATARYYNFWVGYKFKLLNTRRVSISPSLGAGMLLLSRRFPVTQGPSTLFFETSWDDLVFPVGVEVGYKATRRWQLGWVAGCFVYPPAPLIGWHTGPKLSYVIW